MITKEPISFSFFYTFEIRGPGVIYINEDSNFGQVIASYKCTNFSNLVIIVNKVQEFEFALERAEFINVTFQANTQSKANLIINEGIIVKNCTFINFHLSFESYINDWPFQTQNNIFVNSDVNFKAVKDIESINDTYLDGECFFQSLMEDNPFKSI